MDLACLRQFTSFTASDEQRSVVPIGRGIE